MLFESGTATHPYFHNPATPRDVFGESRTISSSRPAENAVSAWKESARTWPYECVNSHEIPRRVRSLVLGLDCGTSTRELVFWKGVLRWSVLEFSLWKYLRSSIPFCSCAGDNRPWFTFFCSDVFYLFAIYWTSLGHHLPNVVGMLGEL